MPCESKGVDLIEEEHAWREQTSALERLVQVALADTEVRVDHILDADVEERQSALSRGGAGQQRLPAAGWPVQQHSSTGAAAAVAEPLADDLGMNAGLSASVARCGAGRAAGCGGGRAACSCGRTPD